MKEVTYEEWQKNPTVRMMWVWNSKVEDRLKRMVLFLTERNPSHPVVALTSDNITTANYKHCAEIEKPRRMTNNEWHYVKDELPRKSDATLCELIPVFVAVKVGYNVSTYGTYWNIRLGKFECLDEVYAWCYAPEPPELPKEIKEND